MTEFEELKEFMSHATDIDDWNARRDIAFKKYGLNTMVQLDTSGFIKTLKFEETCK